MTFTYTTLDGQRVETAVATAFQRMATAFHERFGLTLHVRSGTRTSAEQERIFRERYQVQATGNGPYGDVRYWQGKRWVRHSAAGTVAVPGTSNHEEGGPNGPRSIDIYDSGRDAGVTVRGTVRDKWMQDNAGRFGFENEGYAFREPWHKTYRGKLGESETDMPLSDADIDKIARRVWERKSGVNGVRWGDMLRVVFNSVRWGSKGNWHHGSLTSVILNQKGTEIDVEDLADAVSENLTLIDAEKLAEAVVRKTGEKLSGK